MSNAIFHDKHGRITRVLQGPDYVVAENRLASTDASILIDELPSDFSPLEYYVAGNAVKHCGNPPSVYHEFNYETKQWEEDEESTRNTILLMLRFERDRMLVDSDWTQLPDAPISDAERERWQEYRQALRDMPSDYPNVRSTDEITFPEPPK
jgi:hypothetical protein